ncbi:MAG TPA: peptidyl-prolyl cis-trans isomerase [Fervidobacterium sp.]|nr:hypothetical protein [Fervidobacterium sp.]HOK88166.1 peptidyl-prolyl cis-trans isomerase [Fervidobacterium sp.]HOM74596.1 peptidyl-prolyl cis-trans isomerase [Fervidobacterium sp.]HOQ39735.1 peptidyl-prolyl cis-trans isomerase [Fervidobacterium sp.]HPT54736.1 peptidyl-prolyl cis-trans isomerase [Fervidobacterium sp.]
MSKENKKQVSSKKSETSSSTSSSKVRSVMTKWQQVVIWIVAIAFIAGIALWALAVNYTPGSQKIKRTIEETVGYLTIDGTPTKNETYWVFPEEVEQTYGNLLAMYGSPSLDSAIEEPYLKTLIAVDLLNNKTVLYYAEVEKIKPDSKKLKEELSKEIEEIKKDAGKSQQVKAQYGSLSNYEKELKKQKEIEMTVKAVKNKLGVVTEEEIRKYYEDNREDLMTNYTKAEVQYTMFEKKEELDAFMRLVNEKGITEAASESSITLTDYTVTEGTFPEDIEKKIFGATSSIISFPYDDTYFLFNIKSVQKVDTYDNFKQSAAYSEVVENLQNSRFGENLAKWKKENKISFELRDPVYNAWYVALSTEEKDLLKVYKSFYEELFNENNEVRSDIAVEQKTAFLVVADRIVASTDTSLELVKEDVRTFEKKIVNSVYEQIKGSSQEILRRMKDYYPEKQDISFQYYSKLYDAIKPYLSIGGAYYVINELFEVYQGFGDLAESTSTDLQIRSDSYYKLYEMNKLLGDPQTAGYYLDKLQEIKPDYSINFDTAQKELEDMLAQQQYQMYTEDETETYQDSENTEMNSTEGTN